MSISVFSNFSTIRLDSPEYSEDKQFIKTNHLYWFWDFVEDNFNEISNLSTTSYCVSVYKYDNNMINELAGSTITATINKFYYLKIEIMDKYIIFKYTYDLLSEMGLHLRRNTEYQLPDIIKIFISERNKIARFISPPIKELVENTNAETEQKIDGLRQHVAKLQKQNRRFYILNFIGFTIFIWLFERNVSIYHIIDSIVAAYNFVTQNIINAMYWSVFIFPRY